MAFINTSANGGNSYRSNKDDKFMPNNSNDIKDIWKDYRNDLRRKLESPTSAGLRDSISVNSNKNLSTERSIIS